MKIAAALILCLASTAAAAPLRAVKLAALSGTCAIQHDGTLVCEKATDLPAVEMRMRDLVHAYTPLVVREDGSLVRVDRSYSVVDKLRVETLAVPFKVQTAGLVGSSKNDQLCVHGEKGELACRPFQHTGDDPKAAFTTLPGRFVDVTFAHDIVWALDDKGALWCAGAFDCARLHVAAKKAPKKTLLELDATYPTAFDEPKDAPFWRITDGVKRVYAAGAPCIERTSDAKTLVCWGWTDGPKAYPRPQAQELASVGTMMCARTGDAITCTMFGNKSHEPFTVRVKDAAKMHYGNSRFCVETKTGELRCAKLGNPLPPFEKVTWAVRTPKE